jgi:hypothetical protein
MATSEELAFGTTLAGGAVACAVLEALFDKGILSLDESRGVLNRAMAAIGPVTQTRATLHAPHHTR